MNPGNQTPPKNMMVPVDFQSFFCSVVCWVNLVLWRRPGCFKVTACTAESPNHSCNWAQRSFPLVANAESKSSPSKRSWERKRIVSRFMFYLQGFMWQIGNGNGKWKYIYMTYDMGVSGNRGIPKSSILMGFSIINHPFWGISIFGNTHIYIYNIPMYI